MKGKIKFAQSLLATLCLVIASPVMLFATADPDAPLRIISFTTTNSVKLEASYTQRPAGDVKYRIRIVDEEGRAVVDREVQPEISPLSDKKWLFRLENLSVKAWSPTTPVLYQLVFTQETKGRDPVYLQQRIGFRFFETKSGQLYLNGNKIFLRGIAINPPARGIPDSLEKSKAFAMEYIRFMKSIHVNIIRIPDNENWYNACDELGMMVFGGNYGSTVNGQKPPVNYDEAVNWYTDKSFEDIAFHPSLMIYAMTNEVPYEGQIGIDWEKFLSYAHTKLRQWDDTRLYIANPGYGYGRSGDICDLHRYWGWYYCSPFNFINIRDNSKIVPFPKPVQPVTFTECVGNYTGPDGRYNLTPDHKNPGSQLNWTGHADWSIQSQLADEHQAFTFKKATEMFRRLRVINPELSGVFPFTILFYNWNNVEQFIDMDPKPVTRQAKLSYQPVLVSWENWTTQVYAGSTFRPVVHVVNDDNDFRPLSNARLVYQIRNDAHLAMVIDSIDLPEIPYYSTWQQQLQIPLPAYLPSGKYEVVGTIRQNGKLVSENVDPVYIGSREAIEAMPAPAGFSLYDPGGKTAGAFRKLQIAFTTVQNFQSLPAGGSLVIGEDALDENISRNAAVLKKWVTNGGRIVILRQDSTRLPLANKLLSAPVRNVTMQLDIPSYPPPPRPSRNGIYVNPERPDHPVFDGIRREQLRVWSDYTQWSDATPGYPAVYPVTDGYVVENKEDLGKMAVLANFGVALEGMALVEFFDGKGSILLSGFDMVRRAKIDPVADRLTLNILNYTTRETRHPRYPLITAPIVWGDYTSEKGILTGVNSGLMLHSAPRIPHNNRYQLRVTGIGDRFLGAAGGFNTRPGIQYVVNGRRIFGPYYLRGFGNVPDPIDKENKTGEGFFWCSVPAGKTNVNTAVWNQSDEELWVSVQVNDGQEVKKNIAAGATIEIAAPVNTQDVKIKFRGDRRLVLLQTTFK